MRQLPLGVRLRVGSRFSTFVPGENAAAVAELMQLSGRGGPQAAWLHGPPGSGRTHLLQAACAAAGEAGRAAAYLPMRELAAGEPGVLAGLETLDLVCLDDLEAVAGGADWERALFGLYNELGERGGRLVVAAREPPARSGFALPDLASRFAAASVLPLRPLREESQGEALAGRAAAQGLDLPEDTLQYLLRRAPRDFAALCRLLDEVDVASLAAQRRLTVPLVREVLDRQGH
ncbi:MAG: DnaA regulatory inactivator Hda [Steroidobacteraceae bacterium]|jgi:DnaA family protein|nr:DnaA regulatory inactivator Hda [Steroidobacteraceae bacterium]